MKELLEYIVKSLVTKKDEVQVSEAQENNDIYLLVKVADEDYGKVIGRNGKVAQSLRSIIRSANTNKELRYFIKIGEKE